jgi:hypothetical protein
MTCGPVVEVAPRVCESENESGEGEGGISGALIREWNSELRFRFRVGRSSSQQQEGRKGGLHLRYAHRQVVTASERDRWDHARLPAALSGGVVGERVASSGRVTRLVASAPLGVTCP